MGNCLFGSLGPGVAAAGGGARRLVRVVTTTGGVLEFQPPVTAGSLLDEFPGHRIVRSQELFWEPLPYNESLMAGKTYYLFPFSGHATTAGSVSSSLGKSFGHIRSNSVPTDSASMLTPYRMSVDSRETMRRSYTDALSRYSWSVRSRRVWKVKLIISPEQLQEILSSGDRTQELIDSMRVVAKCGVPEKGRRRRIYRRRRYTPREASPNPTSGASPAGMLDSESDSKSNIHCKIVSLSFYDQQNLCALAI